MSSSAASVVAEPAASLATIPVICGPTASGKSAIAMWLSMRRDITVISADSRQVYRHFDVGTAKPTTDDRRRVTHRAVDVIEPIARFSAADWVTLAHAAIDESVAAGRVPVIVGGTGFYITALFRPLFAEPALDSGQRLAIQAVFADMSTGELRRWCTALDPARCHLGRTQLLRAIEMALLTGARLSELHVAHARPSAYRASYLLVDPGMELHGRIAARASGMFEAGWLEEVRRLMDSVPADAPAWKATGYEAVREHARGALGREATLERVIIETRQYAKRQRTWFRHQLGKDQVQRVAPGAPGWQEIVDRWITGVEVAMRTARADDGDAR